MEESPKKRSFNKNRDGEAASSRKKTTKIAGKSDRGRSSSPKRKNFPKDINDKLEKRRDFADGGE
ncbi:hypothetical protein LJC67_01510, partial [Bacteroidales bacterium OttesenSCG-928-A14]|nr:hypothetical protein [Bacteroidales bacterium OttesenSCG-928-A14]